MLRRAIISLILITCLSGAALAYEPGVFLPFYFIYDDAVDSTSPSTVDGHKVIYYESHPLVSEISTITGGAFMMNIMRARYFTKFSVDPGSLYQVGVANDTSGDGCGMDPIDYTVSGHGFDKVDLALVLGGGLGLLPPDGTVPIDITTGSPDVVINWDSITYPLVDVYRSEGDGTGQYDKNWPGTAYGATRWTLVSDNNATGTYRDVGYIANDPKEAYYKAIIEGHPDPVETRVAAAWAVGKFDKELREGWNLVSTPLVPLHGSTIDDVFIDASGGGLQNEGNEVYYFNESTRLTIRAKYEGGWKYSPNTPYTIDLGNAYWVKELRSTKRISMLGAVIVTDQHRILGPSFSLMSSPIPTFYPALASAGLDVRGEDEIFLFRADTGLQDKMVNKSSTWTNAVPGELPFGLIPGVGYWYLNRDTSDRDWVLSP